MKDTVKFRVVVFVNDVAQNDTENPNLPSSAVEYATFKALEAALPDPEAAHAWNNAYTERVPR